MNTKLRFTIPALAIGAAIMATSPAPVAAEPDPASRPNHSQPKGPLARILASDQAPEALVNAMARRLELTDEQKAKILPIIETARKDLRDTKDGIRTVLEATSEKVNAILTPEQREKAERNRQEMGERIRNRIADGSHRLGGPGGPDGFGRPDGPMHLLPALRGLNLSDDQTSRVRELMKAHAEKRRAIAEESRNKMEALNRSTREQVEALLTTEQRDRLREKLEKLPKPGDRKVAFDRPRIGRRDHWGPPGGEPGRGFGERLGRGEGRGPRDGEDRPNGPRRPNRPAPPDRDF
jgi:Spy/CpxP family protein refolding chaperone